MILFVRERIISKRTKNKPKSEINLQCERGDEKAMALKHGSSLFEKRRVRSIVCVLFGYSLFIVDTVDMLKIMIAMDVSLFGVRCLMCWPSMCRCACMFLMFNVLQFAVQQKKTTTTTYVSFAVERILIIISIQQDTFTQTIKHQASVYVFSSFFFLGIFCALF